MILTSRWLLMMLVGTVGASAHAALGEFEAHQDIGAPRLEGAATYNAASQAYHLSAGGTN
jgi:hypothetical protein